MHNPSRVSSSFVLALLTVGAWRPANAQCPDGTPPPCTRAGVVRAVPNSIAVLAFANQDADSALAWLGGGLAEEIATELGTTRSLTVRGASVVRSAQRVARDNARRVAQIVAVRYVVEGSYRAAGRRVRVSARVLAMPAADMRWGRVYDRSRDSLSTLSDDIARDVATQLGAAPAAPARRAVSPAVYELYQRGRYDMLRADLLRARREFEDAIALDSLFAPAWAGRARSLAEAADIFTAPLEDYPVAIASARRALALDSGLAEAYSALAWAAAALDHDCRAAQALVERAIAIDSADADAWSLRGIMQGCQRNYDGAIASGTRGFALDSLSSLGASDLLYLYVMARRPIPPDLMTRARAVMTPEVVATYDSRAAMARGDCAAAERAMRPYSTTNRGMRLYPPALVCLGRRAEAEALVRAFIADTAVRYVNAAGVAMGLLAVGDTAGAFAWLERGYTQRTWWMMYLDSEPAFDGIRSDPRFQSLLRRLGFQ